MKGSSAFTFHQASAGSRGANTDPHARRSSRELEEDQYDPKNYKIKSTRKPRPPISVRKSTPGLAKARNPPKNTDTPDERNTSYKKVGRGLPAPSPNREQTREKKVNEQQVMEESERFVTRPQCNCCCCCGCCGYIDERRNVSQSRQHHERGSRHHMQRDPRGEYARMNYVAQEERVSTDCPTSSYEATGVVYSSYGACQRDTETDVVASRESHDCELDRRNTSTWAGFGGAHHVGASLPAWSVQHGSAGRSNQPSKNDRFHAVDERSGCEGGPTCQHATFHGRERRSKSVPPSRPAAPRGDATR
eukprot:Rmarinus@m.30156